MPDQEGPENPTNSESGVIDLAALPSYLGYQIRQAQTAVFRDIEAKMKFIGIFFTFDAIN